MTKIWKSVCLTVILAMVLSLGMVLLPAGEVRAQGADVFIDPTPKAVVTEETFTVNVDIIPGEPLRGAQFDMSFDQSLLTCTGVTEGDLFNMGGAQTTSWQPPAIDNGAGTITGAACAITGAAVPVSNPGTFAIVSFTAKNVSGTSVLDLSNVVVGDAAGLPVVVTVTDGQVVITYAPPTVTSVSPNSGNQGQALPAVVITGTSFTPATAVSFGAGITVNSFSVDSYTQITADITVDWAAATGTRDVSVTSPGGTGTLTAGFTVVAAGLPTVTSVTPGAARQDTTLGVTITGTNFTGATAVGFGAGITVNSFTVDSDTQITANITIAVDAALGTRDVSVTIPIGSGTLTDGFTIYPGCATLSGIEQAICNGMDWLAAQQNGDGSWGTSDRVGRTGLALVKFCDHAVGEGKSPFDSSYLYHIQVEDGFDYLFSEANTQAIGVEPAGDPDGDGDGIGVYFYDSSASHTMYETGIALMAISASDSPSRVINVSGSAVDGWTYEQVAQDTLDYIAWAQSDGASPGPRGGWDYTPDNPSRSDNSFSGWVTLGLGYAAADSPYGFELTIPQFVKDELSIWIDYIQNDVDGDTDDGGSGYTGPNDGWVNIYKTGHLLYQMAVVGDTAATQRVQDALDYLERHWDDADTDPGWEGSGGTASYIAMVATMKGLVHLGVDTFDGIDWFDDFSTVLLAQQNVDGSWPSDPGWGAADRILGTEWALLTLQKAAAAELCTITFDTRPANTGSITFSTADYVDGDTVDIATGTYDITANPDADLPFTRWETEGNLSVDDAYSATTTCTVSCGGTLRMVQEAAPEEEVAAGPSRFSHRYLNVSPVQTYSNQPVTISMVVANTGESRGSVQINLTINGTIEQSKRITIDSGSSKRLEFTVMKLDPGTYDFYVGRLQGQFHIIATAAFVPPPPPPSPPTAIPDTSGQLGTGGIIAIVIIGIMVIGGLIVVFMMTRRA